MIHGYAQYSDQQLCTFGGMLCFILQGYVGLGRHADTISTADTTVFNHIAFFQSLISAMAALGLLKISIAFSLLRLSTNKVYSIALWALIGRDNHKSTSALGID